MASVCLETQYFNMYFCEFSVGDCWNSIKTNKEVF